MKISPDTNGVVTTVTTTEDGDVVYVQVVVEPGAICPQCGERKPSKKALKQRAWRSKK